jgi:hypothetical protein
MLWMWEIETAVMVNDWCGNTAQMECCLMPEIFTAASMGVQLQ